MISDINEKKETQEEVDRAIEKALYTKKISLAKNIAALGGASKNIAEKTFLISLKETIRKIREAEQFDTAIYSLQKEALETLDLMESYDIKPIETIDEMVNLFIEKDRFYLALFLAEKGSEEAKDRAIKASVMKEEGESAIDRIGKGSYCTKERILKNILS